MSLGRQDFSGRKLSPQESDAVIADLKKYLLDIADRWLIKGRFHTDMANGTLPMEAIKIFLLRLQSTHFDMNGVP